MRPLAVMIENHNRSRPQTGLVEAEVVYEMPVEGGITRFMALYYHVPGIIGPVRSCREYYVDRAIEVNPLYVYCGASPNGYQVIKKTNILAVDELSFGKPFFRDKTRKAPHNLYTRGQSLIDEVSKRHPMQLPYQRLPLLYGDVPTVSSVPANGVHITYHGNYSVAYRFNPQTNSYDRSMNNARHSDRLTDQLISPGTVVVQEAIMKVVDDAGRQEIDFIGQGRAWIMHAGTVVPATWKKEEIRAFTKYYDDSGREVVFSGDKPVWIQVVAPRNKVTFDPPLADVTAAADRAGGS